MSAASRPGEAAPVSLYVLLPLIFGCVAVIALLSVCLGRMRISPGDLFTALTARVPPAQGSFEAQVSLVLWHIRLPRMFAAAAVGAALAAAGTCFQVLFRNPLVSPDVLGVSAGAGVGAALALLSSAPAWIVQVAAFAGGLGAVLLVYKVASRVPGQDPALALILSGIVVGAVLSAALSFLKYVADANNALPNIVFWLMGSLASITLADVRYTVPLIGLSLVPLALVSWRLNLLALGDDEARALGAEVQGLRAIAIVCATLATASAVSMAGVVGWVGLIVPHAARLAVGPEVGRLLPVAVLCGAGFLIAVDTLARTIAGVEVPLGILTALIGAPVFLRLLTRGERTWG